MSRRRDAYLNRRSRENVANYWWRDVETTRVSISYPFQWRFSSVIRVLLISLRILTCTTTTLFPRQSPVSGIPSSAIGGMRQRSFQLLVFTYGFTYCAGISPPHVATLCGAVDPSSLTLPDRAVVSLSVDGCC